MALAQEKALLDFGVEATAQQFDRDVLIEVSALARAEEADEEEADEEDEEEQTESEPDAIASPITTGEIVSCGMMGPMIAAEAVMAAA